MSQFAISGLLMALLCPIQAAAGGDSDCGSGNMYRFKDPKANKAKFCQKGVDQGYCNERVDAYANIAKEYAAQVDTLCKTVGTTASTNISEEEKYKAMMIKVSEDYTNLAKLAKEKADKVTREMQSTVTTTKNTQTKTGGANLMAAGSASAVSSAQTAQKILHIDQQTKNTRGQIASNDVSDHGIVEKASSLVMGSDLRKELLETKDDYEMRAKKAWENSQKGPDLTSRDGPDNNDTTDNSSKDKKGGGLMDSLNPSTLMGLATAGMGLAAAMKKNPDNSSVSTPSNTTPPAQAVAATGLGGDGKSASQSPNMSTTAKTETPNSSSGGSPAFGGSPFAPESDVTSKGSRLASAGGSTPASSAAGSGPEGFGGSGSSRSPDSAGKDPNAALAKASEDPAAGGFSAAGGGGGGGGLNFGSSSSTSTDPAHTEDPLKETLKDMAAAVDSGNGSTGTSTEGVQADAGGADYSTSNEFLFTRVRSAIQRSLKKGGVVSGLSAKIH